MINGEAPLDDLESCQFEPRQVSELQNVYISAVVCGPYDLFAFAPSRVESVSPMCGEMTGGYELRIRGSGFWASDNVTVRFVPLTEGCLQRGSIGEFDEETGEVVCQIPKFAVPGEFAVEVSMNGKHFTSNGRVFTAFKRPQVVAASSVEAYFKGDELLTFTTRGNLPSICHNPLLRFFKCEVDNAGLFCDQRGDSSRSQNSYTVGGHYEMDRLATSQLVEDSLEDYQHSVGDVQVLRVLTPSIPPADTPQPYALEISYDGGLHYSLIRIQPESESHLAENSSKSLSSGSITSTDMQSRVHVTFFHDVQIARLQPNSFIVPTSPQRIEIQCSQDIPLAVVRVGSLCVSAMRTEIGSKPGDTPAAVITAVIPIEKVVGSRIVGTIPPLSE